MTISVLPAPGGWTVHPVPLAEPLAFLSGADAEAAARRLAQAVRRAGISAEVTVYDRAGRLIAQQPHAAEASPVFVVS